MLKRSTAPIAEVYTCIPHGGRRSFVYPGAMTGRRVLAVVLLASCS